MLALAGLVALSGGAVAFAVQDKVTICHATNSNANPYVQQEPAADGDLSGHGAHTGPLWNVNLKALHLAWGDIIPEFDYVDANGPQHFPGLNWDAAGRAIWGNGCAAVPRLSLTVTKTNDADGDSSYNQDETVAAPGLSVPFRAVVTNTSAVTVQMTLLTDTVGAVVSALTCAVAPPATLAAGASFTCDFTLAAFSPAAGTALIDTVTAGATQVGNPDNAVSAFGSSTVRTRAAASPSPSASVSPSVSASASASPSPSASASPSPSTSASASATATASASPSASVSPSSTATPSSSTSPVADPTAVALPTAVSTTLSPTPEPGVVSTPEESPAPFTGGGGTITGPGGVEGGVPGLALTGIELSRLWATAGALVALGVIGLVATWRRAPQER